MGGKQLLVSDCSNEHIHVFLILRASDIYRNAETLKLSSNGLQNFQLSLSKILILKMLDTVVEADSV